MEEKFDLHEEIDEYIRALPCATGTGYGYFLHDFLPKLCERAGCEDPGKISLDVVTDIFEKYAAGKELKSGTIRTYRYALRGFLKARCNAKIGPSDLASDPWKAVSDRVTEEDMTLFRACAKELSESGEFTEKQAEGLCLITDLAFYCGLSVNDALNLKSWDFIRLKKGYSVNVKATTSASKDRIVEVPECMNDELEKALLSTSGMLFAFGKKGIVNEKKASRVRMLQMLIARTSIDVNAKKGPDSSLKFDMRTLRTCRIRAALEAGMKRTDVMEMYGVSEYYISHLLKDELRHL